MIIICSLQQRLRLAILLLLWLLLSLPSLLAEEAAESISPELQQALTEAQQALEAADKNLNERKEQAQAAIDILLAIQGNDAVAQDSAHHVATAQVLLGMAYQQLDQHQSAATAFEQALAGGLEQSRDSVIRALINSYVTLDNPHEIMATIAQYVDLARCEAEIIAIYADSARAVSDLVVARELLTRGMLRFPQRTDLRRLLVAVCIDQQDLATASQHLGSLQAQQPNDPELWRFRLSCTTDEDERRVIARAALAANPDNLELRVYVAQLSSVADQHHYALQLAETFYHIPTYQRTAIQLAAAADDWPRCQSWLAEVPDNQRDEQLHRIAMQVAIATSDAPAALVACDALIALAVADEAVYLHAAKLSEDQQDFARAEAYYRQATLAHDSTTARYYLARLLLRDQRNDAARSELEIILRINPGDPTAKRMLEIISE